MPSHPTIEQLEAYCKPAVIMPPNHELKQLMRDVPKEVYMVANPLKVMDWLDELRRVANS